MVDRRLELPRDPSGQEILNPPEGQDRRFRSPHSIVKALQTLVKYRLSNLPLVLRHWDPRGIHSRSKRFRRNRTLTAQPEFSNGSRQAGPRARGQSIPSSFGPERIRSVDTRRIEPFLPWASRCSVAHSDNRKAHRGAGVRNISASTCISPRSGQSGSRRAQSMEFKCLHDLFQFEPQPGDLLWIDDRCVNRYNAAGGVRHCRHP